MSLDHDHDFQAVASLADVPDGGVVEHAVVFVSYLDADGEPAVAFRVVGSAYLGETLGLLRIGELLLTAGEF